jgi:hypothetical protein
MVVLAEHRAVDKSTEQRDRDRGPSQAEPAAWGQVPAFRLPLSSRFLYFSYFKCSLAASHTAIICLPVFFNLAEQ